MTIIKSIKMKKLLFDPEMKSIPSSIIGIMLLLFFSCQNQVNTPSKKLENVLAGLTKLTLTDKEENALLSQIIDTAHLAFPVYSLEGELLTQAQIREKQMNVTVDCYSDSITNIKAVVFRDLTQDELAELMKRFEAGEKRHQQAMESLIGKSAPGFLVTDVNGNALDLNAMKGKIVVLNFWFIHCFGCVQEMPVLNQMMQEFKDKDIVFIGLTFDKVQDTKAFLQQTKFDYQVVAAAQNIFDKYSIKPCPTNIVIDKNGQIVFAESGYYPQENGTRKKLKEAIEVSLTKK